MLRVILPVAAVTLTCWFGFSVVSSIDTADIVAYHKLQKHVVAAPFRPGDVVSFGPYSTEPSHICSLDVRDGVLRDAPVNKTYVNDMAESLPRFTGLVEWLGGFFGRQPGDAMLAAGPPGLPFVGRVSSFPRDGETPTMAQSCVCAIAESLARFERVCTVERSLIETRLVQTGTTQTYQETTVGLTVRDGNFFFPDLAQLDCPGLLRSATSPLPQEPGLCGQGVERSFDVALRDTLGVIREQAMATDQP
jgi:hypothetical protein